MSRYRNCRRRRGVARGWALHLYPRRPVESAVARISRVAGARSPARSGARASLPARARATEAPLDPRRGRFWTRGFLPDRQCARRGRGWEVAGFLNDIPDALEGFRGCRQLSAGRTTSRVRTTFSSARSAMSPGGNKSRRGCGSGARDSSISFPAKTLIARQRDAGRRHRRRSVHRHRGARADRRFLLDPRARQYRARCRAGNRGAGVAVCLPAGPRRDRRRTC